MRCLAITFLLRLMPRSFDARTAAAEDMLHAVAAEGSLLMEAAVQSIGSHIRNVNGAGTSS